MLKKVVDDILYSFGNNDIKKLKDIFKYLLDEDKLDDYIIDKKDLLFLSVEHKQFSLFSHIIQWVKNPLKKNDKGDDILTWMIKNDHPIEYFETFISLSSRHYYDLDYIVFGMSPLMLSIILERKKWTEVLIPYTTHFKLTMDTDKMKYYFLDTFLEEQKINSISQLNGLTVLHLAVIMKQKDTISLLRIEGCPSFLPSKTQKLIPMEIGIYINSIPLIKELLLFSDLDFVLFHKNKSGKNIFDMVESLPRSYYKNQVFILFKTKLNSFKISTSGRRSKKLYNKLYNK